MLEHAVSRDHDNRGGAGIGEADRYECTYLRPDVLGGLVYAGDSVVEDAGEPIDHLGNNHGEQFVLAGEVVVEGSGRDTCVARQIGDAEPRGPAADKSLSPGQKRRCRYRFRCSDYPGASQEAEYSSSNGRSVVSTSSVGSSAAAERNAEAARCIRHSTTTSTSKGSSFWSQ